MLWVDGSSVPCSWQGTQRGIRVSVCLKACWECTAPPWLTVMLWALFPSWSTEHIHKASLGSKLKLSSFSMKEIYCFSNPTNREHCFRKLISAANELMKKEKVKSVLPPYLGSSWACESLLTAFSLQFGEGLKRMDCFPFFTFTSPWTWHWN